MIDLPEVPWASRPELERPATQEAVSQTFLTVQSTDTQTRPGLVTRGIQTDFGQPNFRVRTPELHQNRLPQESSGKSDV